jgi:Ca2+-binding RTX toxin-like protein
MTTAVLSPGLVPVNGAPAVLNHPLATGLFQMDMASLSDGRIVAVRDQGAVNGDGSGIIGFFLDGTGRLIADSAFEISQFAAGRQTDPDVAVLADGGIVAVWTSQEQDGFEGGIYGRVFNADGSPRGAEFQISDDRQASQSGAHVRALPEGGFVVGWNPESLRFFAADGQPLADAISVSGGTTGLTDLWVRPDGSVAVYRSLTDSLTETVYDAPDDLTGDSRSLGGYEALRSFTTALQAEFFPLSGGLAVARHYVTTGDRFEHYPYMLASVVDGQASDMAVGLYPLPMQRVPVDVTLGAPFYPVYEGGFAALENGNVLALYIASPFLSVEAPSSSWQINTREYRLNGIATGDVPLLGQTVAGQTLTADLSALADPDGLGTFSLQWTQDGQNIPGATGTSLLLTPAMIGTTVRLEIRWTDGRGFSEHVRVSTEGPVTGSHPPIMGTAGPDPLGGSTRDEQIFGLAGDDTLLAYAGNDTLYGGDGVDRLNAGEGDDLVYGGETGDDLRDVVFAGEGNDSAYGGHGNDLIYGDTGNDLLSGDFGADELLGQAGNDLMSGGQGSDLLYGNDGDDIVNGGLGFDRLNGGAGADSFVHAATRNDGTDWVQDYNAADGDVLSITLEGAARSQFQVNFATTPGAGSVRGGRGLRDLPPHRPDPLGAGRRGRRSIRSGLPSTER